MPSDSNTSRSIFERGVVVLSFDTEQIWGHLDLVTEWQYHRRYPDTPGAYDRLLDILQRTGISATWFVVGGLALDACRGQSDPRLAGLPDYWRSRLPAGTEETKPVWYRRSFLKRLAAALPRQEIGLHGGLTHLIWTDPRASLEAIQWELQQGLQALQEIGIRPVSLSFPRDSEAHHHLLPAAGIRCYRGRTPSKAFRLGRTLAGSAVRALDQLRRATPAIIWPRETMPGLWNIPSSSFLYPVGIWRSRVPTLRNRVARFSKGIEAAARQRGIFHFCFHPANLAESPNAFPMFEEMAERLDRSRRLGDVEILTVSDLVQRMDRVRAPDRLAVGAVNMC